MIIHEMIYINPPLNANKNANTNSSLRIIGSIFKYSPSPPHTPAITLLLELLLIFLYPIIFLFCLYMCDVSV